MKRFHAFLVTTTAENGSTTVSPILCLAEDDFAAIETALEDDVTAIDIVARCSRRLQAQRALAVAFAEAVAWPDGQLRAPASGKIRALYAISNAPKATDVPLTFPTSTTEATAQIVDLLINRRHESVLVIARTESRREIVPEAVRFLRSTVATPATVDG